MDFFDFLTMFGGLAVFLYGMSLMSIGLIRISGSKLESIIEKLTKSTAKAILFGAGVTAIIQSSSATTVMVVGFVNAGFMSLKQAIGVIMGANIGTTITSWILSLAGIESTSFLIRLLTPTAFSPIIALVGIVIYIVYTSVKKRSFAEVLIGFALLMMGMQTMSDTMKPLANDPNFINLMLMFENPVLSILAGLLITAIIQSSSASVGILQAISLTGALSINATIPIILGQNIGTCITAILSTIGTNKNAKRTAICLLLFNIIGTLLFVVIYYFIVPFFNLTIFQEKASPLTIAIVHSVFNIVTTLFLIPFIKQLANLSYKIIPLSEEENKKDIFSVLDDRFLTTPAFALEQCYGLIVDMSNLDTKSLDLVNALNENYVEADAEIIKENEKLLDEYEDNLKKYVTKIGQEELSTAQTQVLSAYIQCINDFERISDHILTIQQKFEFLNETGEFFSDKAKRELSVIGKATKEVLDKTVEVFKTNNQELAFTIEPLNIVLHDLQRQAIKRHIKRMKKMSCTPQLGILFSEIITSYVRVADYCSNIAISFIHDNYGVVSEHAFQEYIKDHDENFKVLKDEYVAKYSIKEIKEVKESK